MDEDFEIISSLAFPRDPSDCAERLRRMKAHMQRCRKLPAIQPGEAERLMLAFLGSHGVTRCPPAYAAVVQ